MEGVAFGLRDSAELIKSAADLGEVRVSGGGASSKVWLQIIADVMDLPVRVADTSEGSAHGAALLAATGSGAFATIAEATNHAVQVGEPLEPTPTQRTTKAPTRCTEIYIRSQGDLSPIGSS